MLTDDKTTEIGYGGGAFGGKSFLGCFWITQNWIAYPGTGWLLGRKDLINLKRTTLITLFKLWKELGIQPGEYAYNQQNNVITHINGSQIFLFDLAYQPSDPLYTRLGGLELTGDFVDESNEVDQQAITIILTRIGRRNNEKYKLHPKSLECFNPDKGHVYQRFYRPWKDNALPPHRRFVQALPTDNPYVTEEYLNQLRNSDRITKERLLLGNFEYDDDPGALVPYDAIVDVFTNTVDGGERYITVDTARFGQDRTVIVCWDGLKAYKIDILRQQSEENIKHHLVTLARNERVPYSHILVDTTGGNGAGVVDFMKGIRGFVANLSPLEVKGIRENYKDLKTQCTFKMASLISNHRVAIRCDGPNGEDLLPTKVREEIIEEIEQWRAIDTDKDGKARIRPKDEVKEILGRSPDIGDAIMMRGFFEYKTTDIGTVTQNRPSFGSARQSLLPVARAPGSAPQATGAKRYGQRAR